MTAWTAPAIYKHIPDIIDALEAEWSTYARDWSEKLTLICHREQRRNTKTKLVHI